MRTYVRACRGDDPARRPGLLLRVGRAARRPAPARSAGDRRRRGRARRELRGQGIRRSHRHGRPPRPAALPAGDRRAAAHVCLLRGEQGSVPRFRGHDAARRGPFDRRGLPRRAGAGAPLGNAPGDRREVAPRGARARRPSHHRRRRANEVPRQGRQRRRQAQRPPRRAAGPRARLPPPAPGRTALGRRPGDRRKAPPVGDHEGRRGRRFPGGGPGDRARTGSRPATARARPQPRSPPRADAPATRLDRLAASARAPVHLGGDSGCHPRRARRPRDQADADRRTCRANGRPPAALRRLLQGDSVPHPVARNGREPGDPRGRP